MSFDCLINIELHEPVDVCGFLRELEKNGWECGWPGVKGVYLVVGDVRDWCELPDEPGIDGGAYLSGLCQRWSRVDVRLNERGTGTWIDMTFQDHGMGILVVLGTPRKILENAKPISDHGWYLERVVVPLVRAGGSVFRMTWTDEWS